MAKENIRLFFNALENDTVLQEKMREKEKSYTGNRKDRIKIAEEILIPIAADEGYQFTIEELKEFEAENQKEGEISDEEIKQVTGGKILGLCVVYGTSFGSHEGLAGCFIIGSLD